MRSHRHARFDIVSFFDLTADQKKDFDYDGSEEGSYCVNINDDDDIHDLGNFMRTSDNRYDGIASCTNTSAHGIVLSNCGEQAVIALVG